jgi:elongation factor G
VSQSTAPIRPILSLAIRPKNRADASAFQLALTLTAAENPGLVVKWNDPAGATICGMDEMELESLCYDIAHEYKIEIVMGEPQVIYLETIRKQADAEGKYIRQTGGAGNYGHCKLRMEPTERGWGLQFKNEVPESRVPEVFANGIERGVVEAAEQGILAGYSMTDLRVTVVDGSFHDQDSNELAFQLAGAIAFKEAARRAHPVVLEPIMSVEISVPEEVSDRILEELAESVKKRRGQIETSEEKDGITSIQALIPLAEVLRSSALGEPAFRMRFARYEERSSGQGPEEDGPAAPILNPRLPPGRFRSARAQPDPELDS